MSVDIEQAPLEQVLDQLGKTTGVVTHWIDPGTAAMPVSMTFANCPLEKAIHKILADVSYTYYVNHKQRIVQVLSSAASRAYLVHHDRAPHSSAAAPLAAVAMPATNTGPEVPQLEGDAPAADNSNGDVEAARALAKQALSGGTGSESALVGLRRLLDHDNATVQEIARSTLAQLEGHSSN